MVFVFVPCNNPFMVKVDGEIAGFALVRLGVPKELVALSSSDETNVISDFFIMKTYRCKGVGKEVAFALFNQFRGAWEIRQTLNNKPANRFWKRVVESYLQGGPYEEAVVESEKWNGPVIVFESRDEGEAMEQ